MKPTIGRIVQYVISAQDAEAINARREHYKAFCATLTRQPAPGEPGMNGHIAHVGNTVREGDIYPAMVVRQFSDDPAAPMANLQVHLDGNDTYWATSRTEGDGPGYWHWPERVEEAHVPGARPPRY